MATNEADLTAANRKLAADNEVLRKEIDRLRKALDLIKRRCDENGETTADRGHVWAASIAIQALAGRPAHLLGEDAAQGR